MSLITSPFTREPNSANIKQWLENISNRFKTFEQARWNQSHIDSLFYAGSQQFVNSMYNFSPQAYQNFYFNLIQQPVNMITGFQRQNRKAISYTPADGADSDTTDQYTRLGMNVCNRNGVYEKFSKSCELTAIAGMNLIQPYLDFTGDDPLQGDLKVKVWEYNSFMIDPFFREHDLSDCNIIWCQEYIDREEAKERFQDKDQEIKMMPSTGQQSQMFYFLPENQTANLNDLLVISYVWYRSRHTKERLYSRSRNQFFDFSGDDRQLDFLIKNIPDLKVVKVKVPTWKVAVVLNDQLMFHGVNPLKTDKPPMTVNMWNYDPHLSIPDLRNRSLIRPMRDSQFLYNYKIINNNDIATATINAGWKRKAGAVQNEENLKKVGQGWDVIINEGFEMMDVEKIIPSAVPQSDLELAQQMADLVYNVSGINLENWSGQNDKQISSLTAMIKQAANLMVFQKYFDQWDFSLSQLGDQILSILLNNWNAEKVGLIIGEEPSPFFYSRLYSKYLVTTDEADLTPTQRNYQAQQKLEINERFGREVIPPSMIIKDMNLQGKSEIMQFLQQQEQAMQENQSHQTMQQQLFEDAKLKEIYSKATANIAMARERHGRSESNIGLFEERLSAIQKNRSLSTKAKMDALDKLVSTMKNYGVFETSIAMTEIDNMEEGEKQDEAEEKVDARSSSLANDFARNIMSQSPQSSLGEQQPGQDQELQQQGV